MTAVFTPQAGHWYGWQMLPGYGSELTPYFSPIRVEVVRQELGSRRTWNIAFLHALYATGVQEFDVRLRTLRRTADFLIGELLHDEGEDEEYGTRVAVISSISSSWLRRACPNILDVPTVDLPRLEAFLNRLFFGSV